MPNETVTYSILKANGPLLERVDDTVVREVPLTIHYNGEEIATLLCSPSQTEELVYGFLLNEGFIRVLKDVFTLRHDPAAPFGLGRRRTLHLAKRTHEQTLCFLPVVVKVERRFVSPTMSSWLNRSSQATAFPLRRSIIMWRFSSHTQDSLTQQAAFTVEGLVIKARSS